MQYCLVRLSENIEYLPFFIELCIVPGAAQVKKTTERRVPTRLEPNSRNRVAAQNLKERETKNQVEG